MKFYVLLVIVSICGLPFSPGQVEVNEINTIREIVFIRTEGLTLAEQVQTTTKDQAVSLFCRLIKDYYKDTQPAMLELCQDKELSLSTTDFDVIYKDIEKRLYVDHHLKDSHYLLLCDEHINRSIAFYTEIAKDGRWEKVSYFSFIALPQLFNIKKELEKIIRDH